MARVSGIDDLFGHVPQKGELAIAEALDEVPVSQQVLNGLIPVPPGGHTPDSIREQIKLVMDEARAAETLPWSPMLVRRFTAMMPYWTEWLKGGEGDRLLAEFKAEVDRLNPPLEQVAPNWRRIWGLPEVEDAA
jgi:hypothetical protein